jgi:hypothetical protein
LLTLVMAAIVLSLVLFAILGENGNPGDKYGPL